MKLPLIGIVTLAMAQVALAQAPSQLPGSVPSIPEEVVSTTASFSPVGTQGDSSNPSVWGGAEYLLWRIKDGPLPIPLVTTGDPNNLPAPGAVGAPGTRVLFGGSGLGYGNFSGMRVTLGGWLDSEHMIGLEGSGFLLEHHVIRFAASSDNGGNPPIYLPVINQDPNSANFRGQGSVTIADPLFPDPLGPFKGSVAIAATTRLWGAEANGLINLTRSELWSLDGMVGFRYLDLQESLRISGFNNDQFDDIQQTFNDQFNTRNQFYGGQLGARLGVHPGRLFLDLTGKVALGSTHQVVDIQGSSLFTGTGFAPPPGVYPGGIFTQPSNIGTRSADTFSVVPQVQLKMGLDVKPWLRATVAYDFLYWSSVVRPGDQIDRNLNPNQAPGATFIGQPFPMPLFQRTDFFTHGVSFGLQLQF